MTHQAAVPPLAAAYFGAEAAHPIVEQEFRPGRGWVTTGYRKRVSGAWILKLRRAGVTHVALRSGARLADFAVGELTPWAGVGLPSAPSRLSR